MTKILYLTDSQFNFSFVNSNSILLENINQKLDCSEYHTSLGDLTSQNIIDVIKNFTEVVFVEESFNKSDSIYAESVTLLNYLRNFVVVKGLTPDKKTTFTERDLSSINSSPILWVFGCSHSCGVGLKHGELKYSDIIAKELNLPLKSVARPGSSVHWSLRHLMNAALKPDDTVIWQITTPGRLSRFNGKSVNEVMLSQTNDRYLLEVYNDDQIYFDQLTLLMFGVQYLRAVGVNFLITSLDDRADTKYKNEYIKYPEYCYAPGFNVDFGTDNLHYGPLSHKNLAKCLLDHLQCNNVYTI